MYIIKFLIQFPFRTYLFKNLHHFLILFEIFEMSYILRNYIVVTFPLSSRRFNSEFSSLRLVAIPSQPPPLLCVSQLERDETDSCLFRQGSFAKVNVAPNLNSAHRFHLLNRYPLRYPHVQFNSGYNSQTSAIS